MKAKPKTKPLSSEQIRKNLEDLISNFKTYLKSGELRTKVLKLIPVFHNLRALGQSLFPVQHSTAARARILYYFRKYPKIPINGDELLVVSGIQEYARRLRELRVQYGWAIASGLSIHEMYKDETIAIPKNLKNMKPDDYVLLQTVQDREAALRWNIANSIRTSKKSVRDRILEFMRKNVGKRVTNEELRYVAGNRTEWARRVRELRTEFGWPIASKASGWPGLDVGVYVLLSDRQSPAHDRNIPDAVRSKVMRRDGYKCTKCSWSHKEWNPSDPRHLEIHHIKAHAKGGANSSANLKTLCTVCHDAIHRKGKARGKSRKAVK